MYAIIYLIFIFFGVHWLYSRVLKGTKPKYPEMPPDGKPDIYYAAGILRPVNEDARRYPWFFKKRHRKAKKSHSQSKTQPKHAPRSESLVGWRSMPAFTGELDVQY